MLLEIIYNIYLSSILDSKFLISSLDRAYRWYFIVDLISSCPIISATLWTDITFNKLVIRLIQKLCDFILKGSLANSQVLLRSWLIIRIRLFLFIGLLFPNKYWDWYLSKTIFKWVSIFRKSIIALSDKICIWAFFVLWWIKLNCDILIASLMCSRVKVLISLILTPVW